MQYKLFVDLDGVLTNFTQQLCRLLGKPFDPDFDFGNDPEVWSKIDEAGEEFWSKMEWMPDGHLLWDKLKRYEPTILSAPSNHKSSAEGKKEWLKINLPDVDFILGNKKYKYADPKSILIDDRSKNIDDWEKAGGIGIKHVSAGDTLNKLTKIMEKTTMKKKACISIFLKQAAGAMFELGPTFTSTAPNYKNKNKPSVTGKPFLFGVDRYKKNLMYNSLTGLRNKLMSQGAGGKNKEPMSNLNKLINRMIQLESINVNSEDIKKELREMALNIFPKKPIDPKELEKTKISPESELMYNISSIVTKTVDNENDTDIRELANKINPRPARPEMKGDISPFSPKHMSPKHVRWAAEKIVDIAKNIMNRTAAIKKIKTDDGKTTIIDKPRLHEVCKPPKIITPKKGGPYKRDVGVNYDEQ